MKNRRKEKSSKIQDKVGGLLLWRFAMEKVLLVSDDEKLFDITKKITDGKYELEWCTYHRLETDRYTFADVVIMHFDRKRVKKDTFEPIVRVKGKLGHWVPILAVIEGGSTQDIFSVLKTGAYDYIETVEDWQKYEKKIEDIMLWKWYLKNYEPDRLRQ